MLEVIQQVEDETSYNDTNAHRLSFYGDGSMITLCAGSSWLGTNFA